MCPNSVGRSKSNLLKRKRDAIETDVKQLAKVHKPNLKPITNTVPPTPNLEFTFEEEFRIYELLVRKDHLLDECFEISLQVPNFLDAWRDFLLVQYQCPGLTNEYRNALEKKYERMFSNLLSGGSLWRSLDMFDEFKNVDQDVKVETMVPGISILNIFNRLQYKFKIVHIIVSTSQSFDDGEQ